MNQLPKVYLKGGPKAPEKVVSPHFYPADQRSIYVEMIIKNIIVQNNNWWPYIYAFLSESRRVLTLAAMLVT